MSAVAFARTSTTKLLVSSWDKFLYSYDVSSGPDGTHLLNKYEHRAPVMDVCFGENDDVAFTAGMDWVVNRVDLQTGEFTALSKHAAPVRCVAYSPAYSKAPLSLFPCCAIHLWER